MNTILLQPEDFLSEQRVSLTGRRFQHVTSIIGVEPGKTLQVGLLHGNLGVGTVVKLGEQSLELDVELTTPPPKPLPLTILLAMPRPKVFKRVLPGLTALGIKHIFLINSWHVDKSYWQSPALEQHALHEQMILGLEQGRDTMLPTVKLATRFKPFVEDILPDIIKGTKPLVAHPSSPMPCPANLEDPVTLAVGPEGGFTDYEVSLLCSIGFSAVHLGTRALRVETAVPALIGRIMPVL